MNIGINIRLHCNFPPSKSYALTMGLWKYLRVESGWGCIEYTHTQNIKIIFHNIALFQLPNCSSTQLTYKTVLMWPF